MYEDEKIIFIDTDTLTMEEQEEMIQEENKNEQAKKENKKTIIEVIDNGNGIKKEQQERIFDKFYRVPTGNIHDIKGYGLGLYYIKRLIETHNGKITVISEYGKGSKFIIEWTL